jgi:hypothetical protein
MEESMFKSDSVIFKDQSKMVVYLGGLVHLYKLSNIPFASKKLSKNDSLIAHMKLRVAGEKMVSRKKKIPNTDQYETKEVPQKIYYQDPPYMMGEFKIIDKKIEEKEKEVAKTKPEKPKSEPKTQKKGEPSKVLESGYPREQEDTNFKYRMSLYKMKRSKLIQIQKPTKLFVGICLAYMIHEIKTTNKSFDRFVEDPSDMPFCHLFHEISKKFDTKLQENVPDFDCEEIRLFKEHEKDFNKAYGEACNGFKNYISAAIRELTDLKNDTVLSNYSNMFYYFISNLVLNVYIDKLFLDRVSIGFDNFCASLFRYEIMFETGVNKNTLFQGFSHHYKKMLVMSCKKSSTEQPQNIFEMFPESETGIEPTELDFDLANENDNI